MAITAALVKKLRETTGAGMMDAKKALVETDGDMDAAIDWLRAKGLAKAAKKAGRTAAEGLVCVAIDNGVGVAVEVNSETDFVAKNADFQSMVADVTKTALSCTDIEALKTADMNGKSVNDHITDAVAKIGENMTVRRMAKIEGDVIGSYIHTAAADNMGRIGVLIAMKGGNEAIAKQIAMHIAASNPQSLDVDGLDEALIEREKKIFTEQSRSSGKPEKVIENMIKGRIKKFYSEVTLLNQPFVVNTDITVAEAAKNAGGDITGFVRFEVGEGIEKIEEDFAAEVAKTMGQ